MKNENQLINETSPYLLQHAHNPVNWHAWNTQTLEKAREQEKMLLISIGYSACHWCHVMEHESFENEQIAELMNNHFICVKVDREERPDVDAVYMNAVQLIHGSGGWPLNCFALPDGKPFYGGTYFNPAQWEALLKNIADLYQKRRSDLENQAQQILDGIKEDNLITTSGNAMELDKNLAKDAINKWKNNFDLRNGGSRGAPKFPMPSNLNFLLQYNHSANDNTLNKYLSVWLDKMAMGGIYDRIGGGFARYSVDAEWKVPHFEKMLYDNGQLISVYITAFQMTRKSMYLEIARETADFVLEELTSPEGIFYSALDADSEGEEGKYYVWTKKEFDHILGEDSTLLSAWYGIDGASLWEQGKNVLMIQKSPVEFAKSNNISSGLFLKKLSDARQKLLLARRKRIRPGLDDKSLTSWNALMIKALAQLSAISGETKYLDAATRAMMVIRNKLHNSNGSLFHNYKNGTASINGFLEDYALTADAAIELYQVTLDEQWIVFANRLSSYAIRNFHDREEGLFWFTDNNDKALVSRKKELYDNVIPSSNSVMALVLFKLSRLNEDVGYKNMAQEMARKMAPLVREHPSSFSNWALLIHYLTQNYHEVVVAGPDATEKAALIYAIPNPRKIVAGATADSGLPVFSQRFVPGKTMIYVCSNHVCQKPVENPEEAKVLLK
jgi:uncharacterized protein